MDSLDTCDSSLQLNHVGGFQLGGVAHISYGGADLQRQCERGDVDVTFDITLTFCNVSGKVIGVLHSNGSTARLSSPQFASREAISPNAPILKKKGSV